MSDLKKINPVTLHKQLYDVILNDIKRGNYRSGDKIPTEFELSKMYNISRVTVRKAIQQLVEENKLIRKPAKGTFVKEVPYTEVLYAGGSFTENCIRQNVTPSTKIIKTKIIDNLDPLLNDICTSKNKKIIVITRIRYVNNTPCIVEIDYFPSTFDFILSKNIKKESFLTLITKATGLIAEHFIDYFDIELANKTYAKYLECSEKKPLLKVTQVIKTKNQKTIYINKQFILTEKYIYVKTN